jgi:predicted NodU family carbamoyl transferase
MPMAPVVNESIADSLFMDRNKIYKSLEYMVCARDCQQGVDPNNYGVTHTSPLSGIRTCRPQTVYNDQFMTPILDVYGYLINTSFNEHGMPIVFDVNDVYRCHEYQKARDKDDRVITFISDEE